MNSYSYHTHTLRFDCIRWVLLGVVNRCDWQTQFFNGIKSAPEPDALRSRTFRHFSFTLEFGTQFKGNHMNAARTHHSHSSLWFLLFSVPYVACGNYLLGENIWICEAHRLHTMFTTIFFLCFEYRTTMEKGSVYLCIHVLTSLHSEYFLTIFWRADVLVQRERDSEREQQHEF